MSDRPVRRGLLAAALVAACTLGAIAPAQPAPADARMISSAEAREWFKAKASWGPTYTGSPAMLSYMAFIEAKAREYGAVDIVQYRFPYDRWYTTEWPDKSNWSLVSDGTPVEVASYATQSGSTGPNGVTAQMVLYDMTLPAEQRPPLSALVGKIVVVKQAPYAGTGVGAAYSDYAFRTNPETFLAPGVYVDPTYEGGYRNRNQYGAGGAVIDALFRQTVPGPAAHVVVLDMPPGAAAGGRQHGTPLRYEVPGVLVDNRNGAKVIADARAGRTGTVKLDAKVETNATAYALIMTLPGKDHGTPQDTAVMMATHTDGPSLVQDSGALGILAVMRSYSKLPRAERKRSIFAVLDVRHFIPGVEFAYPYDYVAENRDRLSKWVIGGVAMEHLGGTQFSDAGDAYRPTGRAMTTYINVHCNRVSVQKAIDAVTSASLPRAQVNTEECLGVNGLPQNPWFGRNFAAHLESLGNKPVWHVTGDWPSTGYQMVMSLDRFNADVFRSQVGTALSLVETLMNTTDLLPMQSSWPLLTRALTSLTDADFADPATAATRRAELLAYDKTTFDAVSTNDYAQTPARLAELRSMVLTSVLEVSRRTTVLNLIAELEGKVAAATAAAQQAAVTTKARPQ